MAPNQTVIYSQLEASDKAPASSSPDSETNPSIAENTVIPYRVRTARPHPWLPTLNELIAIFTMEGYRLKRDYARAAFYTRHTPAEWAENCSAKFARANSCRNESKKFREQVDAILRDTEKKTVEGQLESNRCIANRLTDVTYWRNEMNNELEKLAMETLGKLCRISKF